MTIRVKDIAQANDRILRITWTDDRTDNFDVVALRRLCPCAVCVDEISGVRKLDAASIDESVRPQQVDSVGAYALKIAFSDRHTTGIYTFDYLRRLAEGNL